MPRFDLQSQYDLSPEKLANLIDALAPLCADVDVLGAAVERYPGDFDAGNLGEDWAPRKRIEQTLKPLNAKAGARPLLSRMLEEGWSKDMLRSALLNADAGLALAPTGLNVALRDLVEGIDAVRDMIDPAPTYGNVGDARAYVTVGTARDQLQSLAQTLGYMRALKETHDALHVLQLESACWLDEADDHNDIVLPVSALAPRVGDAFQKIEKARLRLPTDTQPLGIRCSTQLQLIGTLLGDAGEDRQQAGLERLRGLLIAEPKLIDAAMFKLAKALPIRDLGRIFRVVRTQTGAGDPALDRYWQASIYFGEALRGRVLEHAFWQASDLGLDSIDDLLASPPPDYFKQLVDLWSPVQSAMAYLLEPAPGREPINRLINQAILDHERALAEADGTQASADRLQEALEEIAKTFGAFKTEARALFLSVDKALMLDLAALAALESSIAALLRRVPMVWRANLLPEWQTQGWGIR